MPDTLDTFLSSLAPTADRPLLGQTLLVVEDSRFACEALRLLSLRSGARIRRADSLKAAARHLATYRPSVLVVDLGLPDGSGLDLIREMADATPRIGAIVATSGDDGAEARAHEAGAHAFLAKPITNLGHFQSVILAALPPEERPSGPRDLPSHDVAPDRLALRDDLAHAAELLDEGTARSHLGYLAQFIKGLARSSDDHPLMEAATGLDPKLDGQSIDSPGIESRLKALKAIIVERLSTEQAFQP